MALKEIVDLICAETGIGSEERNTLLSLANRAAEELYTGQDLPGALYEILANVTPNAQCSLPDIIGELRAMREYETTIKVQLRDMRPRYSYEPWPERWTNWRLKPPAAIYRDITNAGPLFLTSPDIEDTPAEVIISGSTANSGKVSETVTMDATTKQSVNSYVTVDSIQRRSRALYDVTILDTNGIEVAILRNFLYRTEYQVVDLTNYPWGVPLSNFPLIEILYKARRFPFYEDADEFPCPGFDTAIAMKACEIHYRPQDGKEKKVGAYAAQVSQLVSGIINDKTAHVQKRILTTPDMYHELTPRRYYQTQLYMPGTR